MAIYRQIAHRLRIHRAEGGERVSERPREGSREKGWGKFLDSDDAPTLVELDEGDQVDVTALLRSGAIQPYIAPRKTRAKEVSEDVRETSGEPA